MRFALLAAAIIAGLSAYASAAPAISVDGRSLYESCQAIDSARNEATFNECAFYIKGVFDTYAMLDSSFNACLPSKMTSGRVLEIVMDYLDKHPEKRDFSASLLVQTALTEAFCK